MTRPVSEAVTTAVGERIDELARMKLPPSVVGEARRALVNIVGVTLGAIRRPEIGRMIAGLSSIEPDGTCPVPARAEMLGHLGAAMVVGTAAHFDDFDDTDLQTVIHPTAPVFGALWALGSRPPRGSGGSGEGAADREVTALALGMELELRVGRAMSPQHYDAGWHITGTCGVIGAAVLSSILLQLPASQISTAIALACSMTLGHREAFGTIVKPMHCGKASANGLLAAGLSRAGVTASSQALEAQRGMFGVMAAGCWDPAWLDPADIGERWALLDNAYKPYPCGIVTHPAIEAAIQAREDAGWPGWESVESVAVRCNPLVPELMGIDGADTGLEMRFSAKSLVAAGLIDGTVGISQVSDARVISTDLRDLRGRVRLLPDPAVGRDACVLTWIGRDGSSGQSVVEQAVGSVSRPLSDDALERKFMDGAEGTVSRARARSILGCIAEFGERSTMADLAATIAGEAQPRDGEAG